MTFILPPDLVNPDERAMQENVEAAAASSGTPFISHYSPDEMADTCRAAGFSAAHHVSPDELTQRYFAGPADGLRPPLGRAADRGDGLGVRARRNVRRWRRENRL